jgi:hypothetical protein
MFSDAAPCCMRKNGKAVPAGKRSLDLFMDLLCSSLKALRSRSLTSDMVLIEVVQFRRFKDRISMCNSRNVELAHATPERKK